MIDLEIESAESAKSAVATLAEAAPLCISYHNFENTSALEPVLRRLERVPASVYKIVTTARKPSDNLRLLQFARAHHRAPLVIFAMSEIGLPTRVLTPSLGGLYTSRHQARAAVRRRARSRRN